MSNTNNNGNESTLHEQLCAFVFGELDATESERIEQLLADDPELRAERARLEATIGLVTTHCSGSESLSLPAIEALERQASDAEPSAGQAAPMITQRRTWGMPLQAAAGFTALAAGLLAGKALLNTSDPEGDFLPVSETVAVFEAPAGKDSLSSRDKSAPKEQLAAIGEPFLADAEVLEIDSDSDFGVETIDQSIVRNEVAEEAPPEEEVERERSASVTARLKTNRPRMVRTAQQLRLGKVGTRPLPRQEASII